MQIPCIRLPLRRSPSVQHWRLARRGGGWAAEVCIIRQTIRVLQQLPAVCRTMVRPIQTFMVVVSQIVLLQWCKFAAGSVTYSSNRALCPVGWIVLMKLIATSLVDNSKLWQIACVAPLIMGNRYILFRRMQPCRFILLSSMTQNIQCAHVDYSCSQPAAGWLHRRDSVKEASDCSSLTRSWQSLQ